MVWVISDWSRKWHTPAAVLIGSLDCLFPLTVIGQNDTQLKIGPLVGAPVSYKSLFSG